jgi:hypothetical protein
MKTMPTTNGFSMLPLILTLFLVVGIISAGFLMLGPKAVGQRVTDTTTSLDSMAGTVISWSAATRALPTTLTPVFTSIPRDSWGNDILYIFATSLTTTASGGICGRQATNLDLIVNGAITPNIAFILLSSAGDPLQSTWTGIPALIPTITAYGSGALGTPAAALFPGVPGDLFKIITLNELQNRAGCFATTQGRLRILNNELPGACAGSATYPATLFGEGGVPGYTWAKVAGPAWITVNASGALVPAGTITAATGTYPLTISVSDTLAHSVQKTYNLKVVSCNTPPINFNNIINDYSKVDGSGNNITIDTITHTINLGNNQTNGTNGYGCLWYKINQTLAGKTFRGYFDFRTSADLSPASTTHGDGFTLTIMQGANPTTVCGGAGEVLGYGARDGHSIPGDSFAIEFDTYPNGGENDPVNYDHVAIVKGGSVLHNGGGSVALGPNPTCAGASHPGCYYRNPISWMEDGALHRARIEVATLCNATCSACGPGAPSGSHSLIKAWLDCTNVTCSDLTADYTSDPPSLTHCMALPASMNDIKIGFTEATWGATQSTIISNFVAGFY